MLEIADASIGAPGIEAERGDEFRRPISMSI
jgi:hypothetical protein